MTYFQTPNLDITDAPADARHTSPGRLTPRLICIHGTDGTNSLRWLTTDPDSVVSCHRLISREPRIYKLADDLTICHANGFSQLWGKKNLNPWTLAIEIENATSQGQAYTSGQIALAAKQCVEWFGAHGPLPIFGHYQVDTQGKVCPGPLFPWVEFWTQVRAAFKAVL